MATPYTDANVFPNQVTIPDDGDPITAASVNVPLEGLANRTRYLYNLSGGVDIPYFHNHAALDTIARPGGNDNNFGFNGTVTMNAAVVASTLTVGTLTPVRRALAIAHSRALLGPPERDPLAWWNSLENEPSNPSVFVKQRYSPNLIGSEATRLCTWRWKPPTGAVITSISVFVAPANHISAPPVQRPQLFARLVNPTNGTILSLGYVTDPNSTLAAYNLPHTITLTASATVLNTHILLVSVRGEEGMHGLGSPNYTDVGGILVYAPVVNYTRQTIGED